MALNIVVCLKQIPNPDLQFQIAPDGLDIKREGLNHKTTGADEYALEEAVRLKETNGGRVVALAAGPKRAEQMLREALAKGADEAVRVGPEGRAGPRVGRVARIRAAAIRPLPHDLVLAGVQSDDIGGSATGGLIAGLLGLPHASVVTRVQVRGSEIEVMSELEGGLGGTYGLPLPPLLTLQLRRHRPPPPPATMNPARQKPREAPPAPIDSSAYAFKVRRLSPPPARGNAEMIPGRAAEQAKRLAQLLREKGFVRG